MAGGLCIDFAGGQEKLEDSKMLENAAESHTSGALFVNTPLVVKRKVLELILTDLLLPLFHTFH